MQSDHPAELVAAAKQIRAAVEDPGPHPEFHRRVLRKHRAEWPTLWEAIDRLLEFTP
jgi:hypothetical protein